jgi:hypothetical protein
LLGLGANEIFAVPKGQTEYRSLKAETGVQFPLGAPSDFNTLAEIAVRKPPTKNRPNIAAELEGDPIAKALRAAMSRSLGKALHQNSPVRTYRFFRGSVFGVRCKIHVMQA